jgi:radical SAM protein with 4Fe4S-binding SPASM domain
MLKKMLKKVDLLKKFNSKIKYSLYRLKWNYYPKLDIVSQFPFHVDIETTDACNLRCIMCVHGTSKVKDVGMMEMNFAKRLIDEVSYYKTYSIKFNWRGEPALHNGLVELVNYAKLKGILEVQFNTNGIPYDEKKIRELILAGLDRIIFSMDGAKKETYEKIRVGAVYEKLVNNVKSFYFIKKELKRRRPLIRIQMVRMKENKEEIKEFISMWKPYVDEIKINEVTNRGQGNVLSVGDMVAIGRRRCPQPWQRIVISRDGKVLPCCSDWNMKWIIGDAKKDDLKVIWKSKKMEELRQLIREIRLDEFEPCSHCFSRLSYVWKDFSKSKR